MKENVEFVIDGKEYRVEPYLTTKGFLLLKNLSALLGDPLVRLIGSLPKGLSAKDIASLTNADINLDQVAGILSNALSRLDDATAEKILKDILAKTFYKNNVCTDIFDSHFQGDYWHLMKVIKRTLEAQYGDFLAAVTGGVLKAVPKVKA